MKGIPLWVVCSIVVAAVGVAIWIFEPWQNEKPDGWAPISETVARDLSILHSELGRIQRSSVVDESVWRPDYQWLCPVLGEAAYFSHATQYKNRAAEKPNSRCKHLGECWSTWKRDVKVGSSSEDKTAEDSIERALSFIDPWTDEEKMNSLIYDLDFGEFSAGLTDDEKAILGSTENVDEINYRIAKRIQEQAAVVLGVRMCELIEDAVANSVEAGDRQLLFETIISLHHDTLVFLGLAEEKPRFERGFAKYQEAIDAHIGEFKPCSDQECQRPDANWVRRLEDLKVSRDSIVSGFLDTAILASREVLLRLGGPADNSVHENENEKLINDLKLIAGLGRLANRLYGETNAETICKIVGRAETGCQLDLGLASSDFGYSAQLMPLRVLNETAVTRVFDIPAAEVRFEEAGDAVTFNAKRKTGIRLYLERPLSISQEFRAAEKIDIGLRALNVDVNIRATEDDFSNTSLKITNMSDWDWLSLDNQKATDFLRSFGAAPYLPLSGLKIASVEDDLFLSGDWNAPEWTRDSSKSSFRISFNQTLASLEESVSVSAQTHFLRVLTRMNGDPDGSLRIPGSISQSQEILGVYLAGWRPLQLTVFAASRSNPDLITSLVARPQPNGDVVISLPHIVSPPELAIRPNRLRKERGGQRFLFAKTAQLKDKLITGAVGEMSRGELIAINDAGLRLASTILQLDASASVKQSVYHMVEGVAQFNVDAKKVSAKILSLMEAESLVLPRRVETTPLSNFAPNLDAALTHDLRTDASLLPLLPMIVNMLGDYGKAVDQISAEFLERSVADWVSSGRMLVCLEEYRLVGDVKHPSCLLQDSYIMLAAAEIGRTLSANNDDAAIVSLYKNPPFVSRQFTELDVREAIQRVRAEILVAAEERLKEAWEQVVSMAVSGSFQSALDSLSTQLGEQLTSATPLCGEISWACKAGSVRGIVVSLVETCFGAATARHCVAEKSAYLTGRIERELAVANQMSNRAIVMTDRVSSVLEEVDELVKQNSLLTDLSDEVAAVKKSVRIKSARVRNSLANIEFSGDGLTVSSSVLGSEIRAGDVILKINGELVDSQEQIKNKFSSINRAIIELERDGKTMLANLPSNLDYQFELAPSIVGLTALPDSWQLELNPNEIETIDRTVVMVKGVADEFELIEQDIRTLVENPKEEALRVLGGEFTSVCRKTLGADFSEACSTPGRLFSSVFGESLAMVVQKEVQKSIISALDSEPEWNNNCIIKRAGWPAQLSSAVDTFCAELGSELQDVRRLVVAGEDAATIEARAAGAVTRLGRTFATSLEPDEFLWQAAIKLESEFEQFEFSSPVLDLVADNFLCVRTDDSGLPMFGDCTPPYEKVRSVESFLEAIPAPAALSEDLRNEVEGRLRNMAPKVCLDVKPNLFSGDELAHRESCFDSARLFEDPKTTGDLIRKAAENELRRFTNQQTERLKQGVVDQLELNAWLEDNDIHVSMDQACFQRTFKKDVCIDIDELKGFSIREFKDWAKREAEELLEQEAEKHFNRLKNNIVDPIEEKFRQDAQVICERIREAASDFELFGSRVTFDWEDSDCPPRKLAMAMEIETNFFETQDRLVVTDGLEVDSELVARFRRGETDLQGAELIKVNWERLETQPTLEIVIKEELSHRIKGLKIEQVLRSKRGFLISGVYQPGAFPFPIPIETSFGEDGVQFDLPRLESVVSAALCGLIAQSILEEQPELLGGSVISGVDEQYCRERNLQGIRLTVEVELEKPVGKVPLIVIINAEKGIIVQPPDLEDIAIALLIETLGGAADIRLVDPIYTLADGLTLYFGASIPTPLELKVAANFSVSPRRFRFSGPIQITIPGWYDTSLISFGDLTLGYDPEREALMLGGAATIVPGVTTEKLVKVVGTGTLSLKDQEFEMKGATKVFRVLEASNSRTLISLPERLFEHEVGTGPMLAEIIQLKGLMRIQDKPPNPFVLVGADGELFGADVAAMDVELARDFSANFDASLNVPIVEDSHTYSLSAEERLQNITASAGYETGIAGFRVNLMVTASESLVSVGVSATPGPIEAEIKLPSLSSLTPNRIAELLVNLDINMAKPGDLSIGLDDTKSGTKPGDLDPVTGEPAPPPLDPVNSPPPPPAPLGSWTPAFRYEKVKVCKWFKIGPLKIWTEKCWSEWVPKMLPEVAAQLAAAGYDDRSTAAMNVYYQRNLTAGDYVGLVQNNATKIIKIVQDRAVVWQGLYKSLDNTNLTIYAHREGKGDKPRFVVDAPGGSFFVVVEGSTFDTDRMPLPGSGSAAMRAFNNETPEFAKQLVLLVGSEMVWRTIQPMVTRLSPKLALAQHEGHHTLVQYHSDRIPQMIFVRMNSDSDLVNRLLASGPALEGLLGNEACSQAASLVLSAPCAYGYIDQGPSAVVLETKGSRNGGRSFILQGDTPLRSNYSLPFGPGPSVLVAQDPALLSSLWQTLLSGSDGFSPRETLELTANLEGPLKAILLYEQDGEHRLAYVSTDLVAPGQPLPTRLAVRVACLRSYWLDSESAASLNSQNPSISNSEGLRQMMKWMVASRAAWARQGWNANPAGGLDACQGF